MLIKTFCVISDMEIKQLEKIIEGAGAESKTALDELSLQKGVVYTIIQTQKKKRALRKAVDFFLASAISASLVCASAIGYFRSDYYNNAINERNTEIIQQYSGKSHNKNYQR